MSVKSKEMTSENRTREPNGSDLSNPPPSSSHPAGETEEAQNAPDAASSGGNRSSSTSSANDHGSSPTVNGVSPARSPDRAQSDAPNVNTDEPYPLDSGISRENSTGGDHAPIGSPGTSGQAEDSSGERDGATNSPNDQDEWSVYTRPHNGSLNLFETEVSLILLFEIKSLIPSSPMKIELNRELLEVRLELERLLHSDEAAALMSNGQRVDKRQSTRYDGKEWLFGMGHTAVGS